MPRRLCAKDAGKKTFLRNPGEKGPGSRYQKFNQTGPVLLLVLPGFLINPLLFLRTAQLFVLALKPFYSVVSDGATDI